MRIYLTDSDYEVMKRLESLINGYPKHQAKCFTNPQQLVDAARTAPPDIALIDVDASNGLSAVRMMQSTNAETKIILMSEDKGKVSECFGLQSGGFLKKPIDEEKLIEQLFRVMHPFLARIKYGGEKNT